MSPEDLSKLLKLRDIFESGTPSAKDIKELSELLTQTNNHQNESLSLIKASLLVN